MTISRWAFSASVLSVGAGCSSQVLEPFDTRSLDETLEEIAEEVLDGSIEEAAADGEGDDDSLTATSTDELLFVKDVATLELSEAASIQVLGLPDGSSSPFLPLEDGWVFEVFDYELLLARPEIEGELAIDRNQNDCCDEQDELYAITLQVVDIEQRLFRISSADQLDLETCIDRIGSCN